MFRALESLDIEALRDAQAREDALGAQRVVQDALFAGMGEES